MNTLLGKGFNRTSTITHSHSRSSRVDKEDSCVRGSCLENAPSVKKEFPGIKIHRVSAGTILCEAVLWTRWLHLGALTTYVFSSSLDLDPHDLEKMIERYPNLRNLGNNHAQHFVRMLNEENRNDLFDTGFCAQERFGHVPTSLYRKQSI